MNDFKLSSNAAILIFDLNNADSKDQYDLANNASAMYSVLWDIGEAIRARLKYSKASLPAGEEKFLEELRDLVITAIDKFI
jgi:hypothetical protein